MKKILIVLPLLLLAFLGAAQSLKPIPLLVSQAHSSGKEFKEVSLFGQASTDLNAKSALSAGLKKGILLSWDDAKVQLFSAQPESPLTLSLPFENGSTIVLELVPAKNFSPDFVVHTASTGFNTPQKVDKGVHYWGIVKDHPESIVTISVFKNEVIGGISTADAHYVIGAIEHDEARTHILYKESDLKARNGFVCGTDDELHFKGTQNAGTASRVTGPDNCVRMYIETDYALFQNKGSVANVSTYMIGAFNQVTALYANESINLVLHDLVIWDVVDPYTGPSSNNYLSQFQTALNGVFNGDLAHLVSLGSSGIAYVDVLCFTGYNVGYSGIAASYNTVPTYSWTVEVLTHEIGHNLGSQHTHGCYWNGNSTAIDGCAPTYNPAYAEGTCATGPLPTSGTIMSYCHLLSGVGINFTNGFGTQPGNLVRSRVYNASCLGTCSAPTAPLAPTTLAAVTASTTQINLTWTDVATNETAYKVERATSAAGPWTELTATLAANSTSYSATGLTPSTTYYFQVRASNAVGNSPYSNIANATTNTNIPATPASLVATTASTTQINLTWTDVATDETAYKVERATSAAGPWTELTATLAANTNSYSAAGLNPATTYYFRVRAANAGGNSAYSNTASATTLADIPATPTNLVATAASTTQINLTWTDVATNETAYKVERATSAAGPWTQLTATLAANTTSYSATGLTQGTTYYFQVRASNTYGNSGYSNIASVSTNSAIPVAPTNLVATATSPVQVTLTWTDNATNETKYKVERATNPAGPWTQLTATLAANTVTYNATGLTQSTTYYFQVSALNTYGNSTPSNIATATTPSGLPAAPSNLVATPTAYNIVKLTWTDNATNETKYKVERALNAAGPWTQLTATLAANTITYNATSLTEATTYFFRVRAFNTYGDSDYSDVATATTPTKIPPAPTNLVAVATPGFSTKVDLTWTDNAPNETAYKVERATAAAGPWTAVISNLAANTTAYTVTGLTQSTTYYFRVRASNTFGNSGYSNTADATTNVQTCSYQTINSNNFEAGLGIWTDGGTNCIRLNNAAYANSPTYSMQLRSTVAGTSATTSMSTSSQSLAGYSELTVSFSFITGSFEAGEDFWVQLSTNGGSTYITKKAYVAGVDFTDGVRQTATVVIPGPFTATTRIRVRCDASATDDNVYIDDMVISGCLTQANGENPDRTDVPGSDQTIVSMETGIVNLVTGPNPASDEYNMSFVATADMDINLIISDMAGQVIKQNNLTVTKGDNNINLQVADWNPGLYFIILRAGQQNITQKLMISRQ